MVCCFDGDQAGRQAAWRALENALPVLHENRKLKLAFLPDGEDPDTFIRGQGKPAFAQFIDNAAPALEFLLNHLADGLDLRAVDDRAKFSGLLQPYLDKVTSELLLSLLQNRAAEMMGQSMGRPARPARPQTASTARTPSRLGAISARLLVILLKQPGILNDLEPQALAGLLQAHEELGLFGQIAAYLAQQPSADVEELLVHWSDSEDYEGLLNAAQQSLELDQNAQKASFLDGVKRVLQMVDQQKRRESLDALAETPDIEQLRTYWRHRSTRGTESD